MTGQRDRIDYLRDSLVVDVLRGKHSTGVFYGHGLRAKQHCGYFKEAVNGLEFVEGKAFREHITSNTAPIKFAVGHNRWATLGGVTQKNAHPFRHDEVTGVHNGTIRGGMHTLPVSLHKSGCVVDSDCVMHNLNHVDPGEAAEKVISEITGAYMLIWHDNRDGSLNFVRNDTRSFHMAQAYDEDTLLFASESGSLEWIARRNKFTIADVHFLKPGHMLKFTDETGLVPEVIEIPSPKRYMAPSSRGQAGAGGTKPGKSATRHYPAGGNQVRVSGRTRDVPNLMQEELLELNLAVEDRLAFVPQLKQTADTAWTKHGPRFVSGWLDSQGLNAVCYRVQPEVIENSFNRPWTVRPVGVKHSATVPLVLVEIVTTLKPVKETLTLQDDNKSLSSSSTEESAKEKRDGFPGPEGSLLSLADWVEATTNGCCVCRKPLTTHMADEMRWDLVSGDPQCPDCAKADDEALARLAESQINYYH
jgi:predicted glutamine amidotransferase